MSVDITQSEVAFKRSIKKYFVDNLVTTEGIFIEFDVAYRIPPNVNEWVVFHFDGLTTEGNVATGRVAAYMFSIKDKEGMNLSALRDTLMDYVGDNDADDGKRRVPLVDETFTTVQGMVLTPGDESKQDVGEDGTKYKYVNLYFKFGTK